MREESRKVFRFKKFAIDQTNCTLKVNTDGVLLGAWCDVIDKNMALDIGTGTGLIALMIAQRSPQLLVDSVEIESQNAHKAQCNFETSPFHNRLRLFAMSVQDFVERNEAGKYDLIVSNPPYFNSGVSSPNLAKADARHTHKLSHNELLKSVKQLLKPDRGHFDVILPYTEGLDFIKLAKGYGLDCTNYVEVSSRPGSKVERLLMRFSLSHTSVRKDETMVIYAASTGLDYSEKFIAMTKDFYLFM